MLNVLTPQNNTQYIIPDTGCTGHYVNNSVYLHQPYPAHLKIRMPDGRHITSSQAGCIPYLDQVAPDAAKAHTIPQLSQSLLSIGQLCDHDCTAVFTKTQCTIVHKDKIILTGMRDKGNALWKIPLPTSEGGKTKQKFIPGLFDDIPAAVAAQAAAYQVLSSAGPLAVWPNDGGTKPARNKRGEVRTSRSPGLHRVLSA